jgi:hypothetical protein
MSFQVNKPVNATVFNPLGLPNFRQGVEVSVWRGATSVNKLLCKSNGMTAEIPTWKILPQMSGLRSRYLVSSDVPAPLAYNHIVVTDCRHEQFGKVGKIVNRFSKDSFDVIMFADESRYTFKTGQYSTIRDRDRLFDYDVFKNERSDIYVDLDADTPKEDLGEVVQEDLIDEQPVRKQVELDEPVTYKIQYVTSDGESFNTIFEVNQYIDEQNKQRLRQKKMVLLKAMAQEVGLEFEVDGSSIILK